MGTRSDGAHAATHLAGDFDDGPTRQRLLSKNRFFFGCPRHWAVSHFFALRPISHSLQLGRNVVLALPHEALLVGLKVGDTSLDLFALGFRPIRERPSIRRWQLHASTLRERFRVLHQ
jgi:hypothetical protein